MQRCPLNERPEGLANLTKKCKEVDCYFFGHASMDVPESCTLLIEALCHVKSVGQG